MKVSVAAVLLASGVVSAYNVPTTRSTLRNLGHKSVSFQGPSRSVGASMKMEGTYVVVLLVVVVAAATEVYCSLVFFSFLYNIANTIIICFSFIH
jgi:hypothetical protein